MFDFLDPHCTDTDMDVSERVGSAPLEKPELDQQLQVFRTVPLKNQHHSRPGDSSGPVSHSEVTQSHLNLMEH